jgi:hypothetical protein
MRNASHLFCVGVIALAAANAARAQSTERVSVGTGGVEADSGSWAPALSEDGRFVAFASMASNLPGGTPSFTYNVYVRDRQSGTTECVGVDSSGTPHFDCWNPAISDDGRFVTFGSDSPLFVPGDTNGTFDIFVRDRVNGTTQCVSVDANGNPGNDNSFNAAPISADGRFVAFTSFASNLVAGDTNNCEDVFVRDLVLGTTERISVDSAGVQGNYMSLCCSISADGRFIQFDSYASNLVAGDTNGFTDVFVRDRFLGTTERVSISSSGVQGDTSSGGLGGMLNFFSLSADGRFVVFHSGATNLVPGDTNGKEDCFLRDRLLGTTERVSVDSNGLQANDFSYIPCLSRSGRFIGFWSGATNLVPGDTNGHGDTFVHDRLSGATERVSVSASGVEANGESYFAVLAQGGRLVLFDSEATNLVTGDSNASQDVFVRDRGALAPAGFCRGDGSGGDCPCANLGAAGHGCENSASTGGALLGATGSASLASDTLVLSSTGELPASLSILLQGSAIIPTVGFGDGLRCVGGILHRLYVKSAMGGVATAPLAGDPPISARSAALGDVLTTGSTRYYQTYYRDPLLTFCPSPQGNSWNISSGLAVVWSQ